MSHLPKLSENLNSSTAFRAVLPSVFFAFAVRLIPEILSHRWPIGYDTIYFARMISQNYVWSNTDNFMESSPLFFVIMTPFTVFDNIFMVLKVVAPLLYGLLSGAVFTYAFYALRWRLEKDLFCSFIFALQLPALRISWDLFRNELGLIFMLLTLSLLAKFNGTRIQFMLFGLFSALASFSHEMVTALMLAIVPTILIFKVLNKELSWRQFWAFTVAFCPSVAYAIFLTFWALYAPIQGPVNFGVTPLFDYIGLGPYQYATHMELINEHFRFFLILFFPILPLVLFGIKRRLPYVDLLTVILFALSFFPIISPHRSPAFSPRWMFMLAVPFSFYASEGLFRVYKTTHNYCTPGLFVTLLVLPSLTFMVFPPHLSPLAPFQTEKTWQYLPSSMLSNTIPLEDVPCLLENLAFLEKEMNSYSLLITHEAFYDWALIALGSNVSVTSSIKVNPFLFAESFSGLGYKIYVISWTDSLHSWHGLTPPNDNFRLVFSSGYIGVYRFSDHV